MSRINNVDINKINEFAEQLKKDPSKARKTQVIEGEWLVREGGAQFRSNIKFEGGETTFEIDSPSFMGGGGTLPGPLHYCFFGLVSCYTALFVAMATMLGVVLKKLTAKVEADVNFSQVFGIGDLPIMEEVRIRLYVVSDSPEEKIRKAEELAIQRCPAVYTLKNPVKLTPFLSISKGV